MTDTALRIAILGGGVMGETLAGHGVIDTAAPALGASGFGSRRLDNCSLTEGGEVGPNPLP